MEQMNNHGTGWVRLEFIVPSRGLIGFRTDFSPKPAAPASPTLYSMATTPGPARSAPGTPDRSCPTAPAASPRTR